MIAVAPTQRAGAIRQLSQHAPAAARLLALRLEETGDVPLQAIRDGVPRLTSVGPALRKALPLLAPQAERELAGGACRLVADNMRRGLTRYLIWKNQYLPIPRSWHRAVEDLYMDLLGNLVGRLANTADVEDVLAGHQARLRSLLSVREAGVQSDFEPVCATYAPELQLRLLGLDPVRTPGPVIDLGCGEDGGLVRYLRAFGRDDVVGVDVLCEPGDGLIRSSWVRPAARAGPLGHDHRAPVLQPALPARPPARVRGRRGQARPSLHADPGGAGSRWPLRLRARAAFLRDFAAEGDLADRATGPPGPARRRGPLPARKRLSPGASLMLAIGEESFVAEHGIPCVRRGRQPADLVVIGGGQMFMRPLTEARLRREAVRVERLLPRGQSFALIGYPEQPPGDGSLDVLADTIAAALAPFDRPVQLVGTSYGALVAVRVAARHPEIVSRLALISGGHAFGDEGARRVRRQALLASHHAFDWLQRDLVDLFGRPWFSWLLRLRLVLRRADPVQEMSEAGVIRAYLEAALAATAETDTTWMSNIAARTLVIAGSRDQFFAIPRLRETVEAISHARLVLLPGETHMAPVERPATVRRELGAFLDTATNMAGSR